MKRSEVMRFKKMKTSPHRSSSLIKRLLEVLQKFIVAKGRLVAVVVHVGEEGVSQSAVFPVDG